MAPEGVVLVSTWYCGECGCEFEASGMASEAKCPECGRTLTNYPEIFYNIHRDCGYSDDAITRM